MNLIDIVLLILVIALVAFCGYKGLGHFRGEGGCCGGGSCYVKEEDKTLSNKVQGQYKLKVEGMSCEHCTDKVKHAINSFEHASGSVNLRKQEAIVYYDGDINIEEIIQKINDQGYTATLNK